jgi:hypothetical protein
MTFRGRWRQRVGVDLFEDLLALTLNLAVGEV